MIVAPANAARKGRMPAAGRGERQSSLSPQECSGKGGNTRRGAANAHAALRFWRSRFGAPVLVANAACGDSGHCTNKLRGAGRRKTGWCAPRCPGPAQRNVSTPSAAMRFRQALRSATVLPTRCSRMKCRSPTRSAASLIIICRPYSVGARGARKGKGRSGRRDGRCPQTAPTCLAADFSESGPGSLREFRRHSGWPRTRREFS